MWGSARTLILYSLFAFLSASDLAQAADCKPLQILNTVKLESIDNGKLFLAPVTINGTPEKFLLDTGGGVTQVEHDVSKALSLREESSIWSTWYDVLGNGSNKQAVIQAFGIGRLTAKNISIQISPDSHLSESTGAVGLLSTDLFADYDIDLDFGAERLNYFSQDHCEGRVAYWPERPLAVVPFSLEGGHLNLTITIDGRELKAIIDTGANVTVMSAAIATKTFGVTPGSTDAPQVGASSYDPLLKYYSHKFDKLSFAGLEVSNPNILIMTDRVITGANVDKSSLRGVSNDPYSRARLDPVTLA